MAPDYFVRLNLRGGPEGTDVALKCLQSTAEYFGWLDTLGHARLRGPVIQRDGRTFQLVQYRRPRKTGGVPMKICLSTSRYGNPAGQTKSFRVNGDATLRDLVYLASVTPGDWGWMTTLSGERLSRQAWLDRAVAYLSA